MDKECRINALNYKDFLTLAIRTGGHRLAYSYVRYDFYLVMTRGYELESVLYTWNTFVNVGPSTKDWIMWVNKALQGEL